MKIEWKGGECEVIGEESENVTSEPKQIMASEKTLRDEFAKIWLDRFPRNGSKVDYIAIECYEMADAMMKARESIQ